ncbi:hypothetical protein MXD81_56285, partial [Microbacteriaceae bacterium K1510]|nr:hypothetical protein [Microbacteriaceae bacterium K1510]
VRKFTARKVTVSIEEVRLKWTKKHDVAAYRYLHKYDHEWLLAQPKRRPDQERHVQNLKRRWIDLWATRDDLWAPKVTTAAVAIRRMTPAKRVTKNLIMLVSGLRSLKAIKPERLPKCWHALEVAVESKSQWKMRRASRSPPFSH